MLPETQVITRGSLYSDLRVTLDMYSFVIQGALEVFWLLILSFNDVPTSA